MHILSYSAEAVLVVQDIGVYLCSWAWAALDRM